MQFIATVLADGPDPLASLYSHWPWMVIVVAIGRWLASRADKVVDRHIAYLDSSEKREADRVGTDKQLAVALASISEELKDHGGKLSDIKDIKSDKPTVECPVAKSLPEGWPRLMPGHGGG